MEPALFSPADEKLFKQNFAINFLASYAANHYVDACQRGDQETLSRLPVEDAEFLAEAAWNHWQKIIG